MYTHTCREWVRNRKRKLKESEKRARDRTKRSVASAFHKAFGIKAQRINVFHPQSERWLAVLPWDDNWGRQSRKSSLTVEEDARQLRKKRMMHSAKGGLRFVLYCRGSESGEPAATARTPQHDAVPCESPSALWAPLHRRVLRCVAMWCSVL